MKQNLFSRRAIAAVASLAAAIAVATPPAWSSPAETDAAATNASTSIATQAEADDTVETRIVGGQVTRERWPWMGYIGGCGGSLVAPRWVLTAAHCLAGGPREVRLDSNSKSSGGEVISIKRRMAHPSYSGLTSGYDIALLELSRPSSKTPIPIAARKPGVGTRTKLLGWGATNPAGNNYPEQLKELDTSIISGSRCQYGFTDAFELCTDNPGAREGACFGDSGGPQIQWINNRWELVGDTSRGPQRCASEPSIYTSTTAHIDWLRRATNNEIPAPGGGGGNPGPVDPGPVDPGPVNPGPGPGNPGGGDLSDNNPQDIRDMGTIRSTINSNRSGAARVTVGLNVSHPCSQNLEIAISTPDGVRNVVKRSTSANRCDNWNGVRSETYPLNSKSDGSWVLEISDQARGNEGRFNGWNLSFS